VASSHSSLCKIVTRCSKIAIVSYHIMCVPVISPIIQSRPTSDISCNCNLLVTRHWVTLITGNTNHHNASTNLHTLQIITAHAKYQSVIRAVFTSSC
jgi:hypothetical protein